MTHAARRAAITGRIRSTHLWTVPWAIWIAVAAFAAVGVLAPFHPTYAAEEGLGRWWIMVFFLACAALFAFLGIPLGIRVGERGIVAGKWFWFRRPEAFPFEAIDPASVRRWTDVGAIVRGFELTYDPRTLAQPRAGSGVTFVAPDPTPRRGREYELWTLALRDPARLLTSWADALDAAGRPGGDLLRQQAAHPATVGAEPAGLASVPVPAYLASRFRAPQHPR